MVTIPPPLQAVIMLGKGKFKHDTTFITMPPFSSVNYQVISPPGYLNIIFAMNDGDAIDVNTGEHVYSSDFGFVHEMYPQMLQHFDPAAPSLIKFEYPHFIILDGPIIFTMLNLINPGRTIIWDYTLFYVQIDPKDLAFVRKLFLRYTGLTADEANALYEEVF
jgi:hypothetical protein